jgi:hypothetical protein
VACRHAQPAAGRLFDASKAIVDMQLRILLTHHLPLDWSAAGQEVGRLADKLRRRGHAVRCLVVDPGGTNSEPQFVRRVVCNPDSPTAELNFPLPTFDWGDRGHAPDNGAATTSFSALTDAQLAAYRDKLREVLDDEVAHFNPHVIHGQHIWIQGHLALEAGVPYLLTARGPELDLQAVDARYRRYAQEAAENAGRIIAPDERIHRAVTAAFGDLEHRVVVVPDHRPEQLEALYREVLLARFGADFDPAAD